MSRSSSGGSKKEEGSELEMIRIRKLEEDFQNEWLPSQKRGKSQNPFKFNTIVLPEMRKLRNSIVIKILLRLVLGKA